MFVVFDHLAPGLKGEPLPHWIFGVLASVGVWIGLTAGKRAYRTLRNDSLSARGVPA
jgi:hypothetical protein